MDDTPLIEASGIGVNIGDRAVLRNAAAIVRAGEIVTLIGPNGAGKTTLVRVMLGLIKADVGRVWRRSGLHIGYVPQNMRPDSSLPMTVGRFLAIGVPPVHTGEGRRVAVLQEVGAMQTMDSQLVNISGGELRRVMLARALLRNPDLLVLDEPVQGVDVAGQADLYSLIGRIRDKRRCGVLMVSHELHLVMAATDNVICLNQHVCCAGHPASVARDPAFVGLFGENVARDLAVYHHNHDHHHDPDGTVVPNAKAEDDNHG